MDFQAIFCGLSGHTLGEYYKNFNHFKQQLHSAPKNELITFLDTFTPRNLQETILYVKLILEYERIDQIKAYLLKDHVGIGKLIAKHKTTLQLIENLSPAEFITDVCPQISFVIRNRLLSNVAKTLNAAQAEAYFTTIFQHYGLEAGRVLLMNCRYEFITSICLDYNVAFTMRELTVLHQRHGGKFLEFYFDCYKEIYNFTNYEFVAQYLAFHDVDTLTSLIIKHGVVKIGRKAFKNLLKTHKSAIIEKPTQFSSILRPSVLRSVLNETEYKQCFANLLEQKPETVNYMQFKFIKGLPRPLRGKILFDVFQSKYQIDLATTKYLWSNEIAHLTIEDRQRFDLMNENNWYLNTFDTCFDLVKNKIALTQKSANRAVLLESLINCCKVNNDIDGLLSLLKYFHKKHKNDVQEVRSRFIMHLMDQFKLEDLSDEHFKLFEDIHNIFELNNEEFWRKSEITMLKIKRCFKNNLDADELIKKYMEMETRYCRDPGDRRMLERIPLVIQKYFNEVSEEGQKEKRKDVIRYYFQAALNYNRIHRKNQWSLLKYPQFLYEILDESYYITQIINFKVKDAESCQNKNDFIKYLLTNLDKVELNKDLLKNMLVYQPEWLKTRLENILRKKDLTLSYEFCYLAMKMHYLGYPELLLRLAHKFINENVKNYIKINNALSILSFTDDFNEHISKFTPKVDATIDISDLSARNLLNIQRHILKLLRKRPQVTQNVHLAMNFFTRDYLQYALQMLYYGICNMRHDDAAQVISELSNRAVTVRKHTFLLCRYLNISKIIQILSKDESNTSVRMYLLQHNFKIFIQTASQDVFDILVEKQFKLLNPDDGASRLLLMRIQRVHTKFLCTYLQRVCELLSDQKYSIVQKVNTNRIKYLSDDFITWIIQQAVKDVQILTLESFCYKWMLINENNCSKLFSIVNEVIGDDFQLNLKRSIQAKSLSMMLIKNLLNDRSSQSLNLCLKLQNYCQSDFQTNLWLDFTIFYLQSGDNYTMQLLVSFIQDKLQVVLPKNGVYTFNLFVQCIHDIVETIHENLKDEQGVDLMIVEKLWVSELIEMKLLAVSFMPECIQSTPHLATRQWELIKQMVAAADPTIVVTVQEYLSKLNM